MNKTKLIVLISQPINKFNSKRFGLNIKNKNFSKEFWCLLPIINKNLSKKLSSKDYRVVKHNDVKNIESIKKLFLNILKLKKGFYFLNWSGTFKHSVLMEILLKYKGGIKILRMFSNVPTYRFSIKSAIKLYELDKIWFLRKSLTYLINKFMSILKKPFEIKTKYFFLESSFQREKFKSENKNVFFVNSFDYSEYLRIQNKTKKKKNIIFIDSEKDNSFESQLLGIKRKNFNKDLYWKTLLKIFFIFEKKFNSQIKIAGHFRRSSKNVPINREFIFDKTPQLIRDSKLVLAHNSTTVIWSVLFNKPMVLINFKNFQYRSMDTNDEIEFYRKSLGARVINVDLNYRFKIKKNFYTNLLKIDQNKYKVFKEKYLINKKIDNSDRDGWKTMIEKLKDLKINHS